MDDARLVQQVQAEKNHLQGLLHQRLVQPVFRKAVSEVGEAEAQRLEDEALVRPMGAGNLEVVQHQPQQMLSRMVPAIDGCEMLRNGHFVVYRGGITVPDTDL